MYVFELLKDTVGYAQKIERELLLVEGIQQMEFHTVMLIDAAMEMIQ